MIFEYLGPDWISYLPVVTIMNSGGRFYPSIEGEPGACLVVVPHAEAVLAPGFGLSGNDGNLRWHVTMRPSRNGMIGFSFGRDNVDMLYTGA